MDGHIFLEGEMEVLGLFMSFTRLPHISES